MAIQLANPVVVPAQSEKVFDEVWLVELQVSSSAGDKCHLQATVCPARTLPDGSKELNLDARQSFVIRDFFASATEAELVVMYQLVAAIKARAGV